MLAEGGEVDGFVDEIGGGERRGVGVGGGGELGAALLGLLAGQPAAVHQQPPARDAAERQHGQQHGDGLQHAHGRLLGGVVVADRREHGQRRRQQHERRPPGELQRREPASAR